MDDLELRKWAIEQAVKLHSQSGITTEGLLREAAVLLDYVKSKKDAA